MEARSVSKIPIGNEWQYEPKWDGFRCLVFRDGGKVELQSKSGQPPACAGMSGSERRLAGDELYRCYTGSVPFSASTSPAR